MPQAVADRLKRIVAGDQAAAAWLYDQFGPRLYRRLKARYGGHLDVDDLFHDAYVVYFRNGAKLIADLLARTPAAELSERLLERFLWDHACGVASNRRRSAATRKGKVVAISEIQEPAGGGDQEEQTLSRDTLRRIVACLAEKSQRVLLYLSFRFIDGLSPEEISRATGWSRKATYKLKQTLNQAVAECAGRLGITVG